jgi:hypothetical protein
LEGGWSLSEKGENFEASKEVPYIAVKHFEKR